MKKYSLLTGHVAERQQTLPNTAQKLPQTTTEKPLVCAGALAYMNRSAVLVTRPCTVSDTLEDQRRFPFFLLSSDDSGNEFLSFVL